MNEINRIIKRRTCKIAGFPINRKLVVMLEPGDVIAMREAGRQKTYRGSIDKIFWMLCKWQCEFDRREKSKRKKLKGVSHV